MAGSPTINQVAPRNSEAHASPCLLRIEDATPAGVQRELRFESFPIDEGITESYTVNQPREIGADRMPQPGGIAYRGGNWGPFTLKLEFHAGVSPGATPTGMATIGRSPDDINEATLQQLLIEMESKARWCQALCFPLERSLAGSELGARITANAKAAGFSQTTLKSTSEALSKIKRNDPPIVLVVLGSWYTLRGWVSSVQVQWTAPWHPVSARPYGAIVSLTIQPLYLEYPSFKVVSAGSLLGNYTTFTPGGVAPLTPIQAAVVRERAKAATRQSDNAARLAVGIAGALVSGALTFARLPNR